METILCETIQPSPRVSFVQNDDLMMTCREGHLLLRKRLDLVSNHSNCPRGHEARGNEGLEECQRFNYN